MPEDDVSNYILVECTLRLHTTQKIEQLRRKRTAIAAELSIEETHIDAYLISMTIDADVQAELRKLATIHEIKLVALDE